MLRSAHSCSLARMQRATRPQCATAATMATHTLGSWSRRLAARGNSRNGHRCNCQVMLDSEDNAQVLQEILQLLGLASRAGAHVRGSPETFYHILLSVVKLTLTIAKHRGNAGGTYRAVRDALVSARDNPDPHSDVSPPPMHQPQPT